MSQQNPFFYNLPAQPENFVGRWTLVDGIVASLCRSETDSWAIIGGRRFGKSSVLKAIEFRLQERQKQVKPGERLIIPVPVDLKRCNPGSAQHVYACIVRYLHYSLRQAKIPDLKLTTPHLDFVAGNSHAPLSFFDLEDVLVDLTSHIEKDWGIVRLAFLLDEVEAMTRYDWSQTLFDQLRALIYSGPLANTVKIVLAGAANIIRIKQAGSPLLNALKTEHLAALDTTAMQMLVALGGPVSDVVVDAVLEQSGGHPFVAQYLLHHLWNCGLAHLKPEDVAAMAHHLRHNRVADLQGWWKAIGDSGRWAYAALVANGDWIHESDLLQVTRGATQSLDWGLAALCYHGLVVRHSDWVHYRVAGQMFSEWFKFRTEQHLAEVEGNVDLAQMPRETRIYQTIIHGNVNGLVASGQFQSAAALGGGEAVDQRRAQEPLYKPQETVKQDLTEGDNGNDQEF